MADRFPTNFPREEIGHLIAHLRGTHTDPACALECAWWVAGYALSFVKGGATPPLIFGDNVDDVLAGHLEETVIPRSDAAGAIPWNIILPLVIDLIRRLLERK